MWLTAAGSTPRPAALALAGWRVDFAAHQAHAPDGTVHMLPQKELMILRLLSRHVGEVVSRESILDTVWGHDVYPSSRTVDNFIVRLRRRFEPDAQRPQHLHTVRGVGYRLTLAPTPAQADSEAGAADAPSPGPRPA